MHTSGEWISQKLLMSCSKKEPQAFGSAITYARRYALQSILGIPCEDDDGNSTVSDSKVMKETEGMVTTDMATEKQRKAIFAISRSLEIDSLQMKANIASWYDKDSSEDLTFREASDCIKRLKEMGV